MKVKCLLGNWGLVAVGSRVIRQVRCQGETLNETFTHIFPGAPGAKSTVTLDVSVFAVMVIRTVANN